MSDSISRADALQCKPEFLNPNPNDKPNNYPIGWNDAIKVWYADIKSLPSAEAEWIPCSERLPSDSGDYLVWLEDESEHYAVIPFDADAGGFGWWQDYYHPVSLGFLDSEFIKAENVTAWQPLPKPYREDGEA